jgi:tellurite resistance-related uncharacterized protein
MNLKKLTTLLFAGVTAATPFATNAQNPTILQGNYISNVFGQANFVLNPNAQTNVANVTLTNATATRSTTTPLVATSEWNVTVTSANGTATWATRSFDAGMKNQNCEARFSYRGFQATSKAQIKQGANVVAELTLTPSATDPRIASINFPCGDLSSATTFVITDSATLSGTNEIGGIYVGLATNQANVAQAESLIRVTQNTGQAIPAGAATTIIWNTVNKDVYGEYNASTGVFKAKRAGTYLISAAALWTNVSIAAGEIRYINFTKNGATIATTWWQADAASNRYVNNQITSTIDLVAGDEIKINAYNNAAGTRNLHPDNSYNYFSISRFPSSSELVVTPETQNVWGGVMYTNQNSVLHVGAAAATSFDPFNDATWNQPTLLKGKAQVTTTNSGNDLGFSIPNLPIGNYKVQISGVLQPGGAGATGASISCNYKIVETTTSTDVAKQAVETKGISATLNTRDFANSFTGVFQNTSVATRNFRLEANKQQDTSPGAIGYCQAFSGTGTTGQLNTNITLLVEPLDNASNSALYVQGPVKAAGTGAAIPAGYVGEKIEATGSSISVSTSATTITSLSLTPGVWSINFNAFSQFTASNAFECGVATAPNSTTGWNTLFNYAVQVGATSSYPYAILSNYYVSVTTTTPYYLTCRLSSGTVLSNGRMHAIRIN